MTNLAKVRNAEYATSTLSELKEYRRLKEHIAAGKELVVQAGMPFRSFGHQVTVTPAINEHICAEIDERIETLRQTLIGVGFDPDDDDSNADEL